MVFLIFSDLQKLPIFPYYSYSFYFFFQWASTNWEDILHLKPTYVEWITSHVCDILKFCLLSHSQATGNNFAISGCPKLRSHKSEMCYSLFGNDLSTCRYCIAGKFGKFGESRAICQTKIIQISTYNYNLLAESIHSPNFFCQMFKTSKFAKLYSHQAFLLYSILNISLSISIIISKFTVCHFHIIIMRI